LRGSITRFEKKISHLFKKKVQNVLLVESCLCWFAVARRWANFRRAVYRHLVVGARMFGVRHYQLIAAG
jgi:hypothetical protein